MTEQRREALVFLALVTIASLFGLLFWPLPYRLPFVVSGAADVLLFAIFLGLGRRGGALANPFLVVATVVTLLQTWMTNDLAMRAGMRFEPFLGYKLFPLALAILAPSSLSLAVGAITATAILPLLQTYHWPASARLALPAPEPWITLLYSIVALVLLLHRRRALATQGEMVRAQTKSASAERFMHKFLAVRDLANSPLQSIEATLAVLRAQYPQSQPQFERLERQLDRLHKLSKVLSQYEPHAWSARDQSFDPLEVLQQLEDSPTEEYDRFFLVGPGDRAQAGEPDGQTTRIEQLLRFTSLGLELSPVCAFWLGEDGRLAYVNRASCSSLGYSRSELLGMHISSFAPNVSRDEWPRRFDAFRHAARPPYESVHRRKDGTLIDVEIIASYAELGGRGYILGFAREIESSRASTDERRMELSSSPPSAG